MPLADEPSRARKSVRAKRGAAILAALVEGASVDEIAENGRLSPKRVETVLREELRRPWFAPADDDARLQILRLHRMSARLTPLAEKGSPPAIDRLLRIMDRLDRYHGFSKLTPVVANEYSGMHERLMAKINGVIARLTPPGDPS